MGHHHEVHERVLTEAEWRTEIHRVEVLERAVLDLWANMDARDSVYLQTETIKVANGLRDEEAAGIDPAAPSLVLQLPNG